MEVIKKEEKVESAKEKLSYEELENVARQLSEQSKQLYQKLQEANLVNLFKRLDFLFQVVNLKDSFEDKEFVAKCQEEIKQLMTLPQQEESFDDGEEVSLTTTK